MSRLIACLCIVLASAAFARDASDLRKAPVGTKFVTSKGISFTLVFRSDSGKEAWLDEESGILWGDQVSERIHRKGAASLCARGIDGETVAGGHHLTELPTLADFAQAEAHGFREVLPNMKNAYYWIRSSVPGAANVGHVFSGNLGKPILILYRSINFEHVRCVQRNAGSRLGAG